MVHLPLIITKQLTLRPNFSTKWSLRTHAKGGLGGADARSLALVKLTKLPFEFSRRAGEFHQRGLGVLAAYVFFGSRRFAASSIGPAEQSRKNPYAGDHRSDARLWAVCSGVFIQSGFTQYSIRIGWHQFFLSHRCVSEISQDDPSKNFRNIRVWTDRWSLPLFWAKRFLCHCSFFDWAISEQGQKAISVAMRGDRSAVCHISFWDSLPWPKGYSNKLLFSGAEYG